MKIGINISGTTISHLLYRAETLSEYLDLRDRLIKFCTEFVETQFNGRAVSVLILEEPLFLEGGCEVSVIELPAPRPVHMYPTGLESIGVVLGKTFTEFIEEHKNVLTGIKDHGKYCQPAFVTFENEKTAKFYNIDLIEIVTLQGWKIEKLGLTSQLN